MSRDWLNNVYKDSTLWDYAAFNDAPSLIAHEYHRVYDMVKDGQVYGLSMQIKDALETMLKYEVLLACAWVYTRSELIDEFEEEVASQLVERVLSLGDWVRMAREVYHFFTTRNIQAPAYLTKCLKDIRDSYERKQVVSWRNRVIGHGALGFEDDPIFQSDIIAMIRLLSDLFRKNRALLAEQMLYVGTMELRGYAMAKDIQGVSGGVDIYIKDCSGNRFSVKPWIMVDEGNIYFFDKQKKEKLTSTQSYIIGHHKDGYQTFFTRIYNKHLHASIDREMGASLIAPLTQDVSNLLNRMNEADDFKEPVYITEWLQGVIEAHESGIFLLKMNRGMGKSAFTEKLNSLCNNPVTLTPDLDVRTYHVQRSNIRGCRDFEAEIEGQWKRTYSGKNEWADADVTTMARYREQHKSVSESMVAFLHDAHVFSKKHRGFRRIMMVIDGLDEIPSESESKYTSSGVGIWEHLIGIKELPKGVYILLTSRDPESEILPDETVQKLAVLEEMANVTTTITKADYRNKSFLGSYFTAQNLSVSEDLLGSLLSLADYRILGLRMLCRLIQAGIPAEQLLCDNEKSVEQIYFEVLSQSYGEKETFRLKELLALLSTLGEDEALSVSEIAYFINGQEVNVDLLSKLNDLEPMLSVVRGYKVEGVFRPGETRYCFSNKQLARVFRELIPDVCRSVAKALISYAFSADTSNAPDADFLLLVWSHMGALRKAASEAPKKHALEFPTGQQLEQLLSFFAYEPKNALQQDRMIFACMQLPLAALYSQMNDDQVAECRLQASSTLIALGDHDIALILLDDQDQLIREGKCDIKPGTLVELYYQRSKVDRKADDRLKDIDNMISVIEKGAENESACAKYNKAQQLGFKLQYAKAFYLREGRYKSALQILDLFERVCNNEQVNEEQSRANKLFFLCERAKIYADCGLEWRAYRYLREIQGICKTTKDFHELLDLVDALSPYISGMYFANRYVLSAIRRAEKRDNTDYSSDILSRVRSLSKLSREMSLPVEIILYSRRYRKLSRSVSRNVEVYSDGSASGSQIESCKSNWERALSDYYSGRVASCFQAAEQGVFYGELLTDSGAYESAIEILNTALILDKAERHYLISIEGNYWLGMALAGLERHEDAITAFRNALNDNSELAMKSLENDNLERKCGILYRRLRIEEALEKALIQAQHADEALELALEWFRNDTPSVEARKYLFAGQLYSIYKRLIKLEKAAGKRVLNPRQRKYCRKLRFKSLLALGDDKGQDVLPARTKIPDDQHLNLWHKLSRGRFASYYYPNKMIEQVVYPMCNPYKPSHVWYYRDIIGKPCLLFFFRTITPGLIATIMIIISYFVAG